MSMAEIIWSTLHIYRWRDFFEITFFVSLFYYLCLWLKQDQQKPLLPFFYGYCSLTLLSYWFALPTVTYALINFSPVLLVCFIIVHQSTLQKNFITLHSFSAQILDQQRNYEELIVQSFLIAASDGISVSCVIEKADSLATFLTSLHLCNAQLSQPLLDALLQSPHFDSSKIIWLDVQGKIIAFNSNWNKSSVDEWLTAQPSHPQWMQDALFYTTKTDSIFIRIDPVVRTFTFIAEGTALDHVAAHQLIGLLKKQLHTDVKASTSTQGEKIHVAQKKQCDGQSTNVHS